MSEDTGPADSAKNDALEVAKLPKDQYEQWCGAFDRLSPPPVPPEPPASIFGRIWNPARTERKLVLFTLAVVAFTIVCGTLLYVATEADPSESVVAAMTTLAGTALGFIGGMVTSPQDKARSPEEKVK